MRPFSDWRSCPIVEKLVKCYWVERPYAIRSPGIIGMSTENKKHRLQQKREHAYAASRGRRHMLYDDDVWAVGKNLLLVDAWLALPVL